MHHDLRLAAHRIRLEPLEQRHAAALLAADSAYAFAVVGPDDEVRSSTRSYDHVPAQRRVEICNPSYGRQW